MKTTIRTEYHDNGKKREEGSYKDGKKDGLWTSWYLNGKKKTEGSYKDGDRDGFFTEWHKNGHKREEGNYKNGKVDGIWSYWYESGQKKEEGDYKEGKKDGVLTLWYENGHKMYEVNYRDEKVCGVWSHWYESGQKKEEKNYKDEKEDGLRTLWHKKGKKMFEGSYCKGVVDGVWTYWYENGKKKEERNYKMGQGDGLRTVWYKNGQKKLEEHYKDGDEDGIGSAWHENGQNLNEVQYIDMRQQSSMSSTWDEYLCIERISNKEFELSIRSYEVLGELFEFQDEEGNLPDEIDGASVVGSWEEFIIGGNLIPRSDEYGEVRFRDFENQDVFDWLGSVDWDSKKIRKELKKLSKLEKDLQKTVEKWAQFLVGPNISHGWGGLGWKFTKSSVVQYILDYILKHGDFPKGVHQVEIRGMGNGKTRTVNFDGARYYCGDDSIDEFILVKSDLDIPSMNLEHNEIYYPSSPGDLEDDKNGEFVFRGSLINGLEIDLLKLSGIELTLSDVDKIWGDTNERVVVTEELDCEEIDLYESDDMPGQSDSYYEYRCNNKGEFVRKLRAWIIKLLEESN